MLPGMEQDAAPRRKSTIFGRVYRVISEASDRSLAHHRADLVGDLSGRVCEVGAGNGLNFRHYPDSVTEVVAVEPDSYLRRWAESAAESAAVPVTVVDGVAAELPIDDDSVDAVVCSLVLCSVPDQHRALEEAARILRPGGELRFYEHVVAETPRLARFQQRTDRVWPRIAGGCHTARDTVGAIAEAGFDVSEQRRFDLDIGPMKTPVSPHVIGRAVLRN